MDAYMRLGNAPLKKEEYDDAILYSEKCLAIAQESGDKMAEMNAYMTLGDAHLKKEEYDDAILYSEKCLAIAQESGNKVPEMNAHLTLGDAHLKKEEYDDAILYSEKCLPIAQESGDKVAEMNAYMRLGDAHLKKEEYDDAILYSRKCLPIAQESGDKVAEMNAFLALENAYSNTWPCSHYKRKCAVKFPCCKEFYFCHRCHNDSAQCEKDDMKARHGTHLRCLVCLTVQEITENSHNCIKCNTQLAEYFCGICKQFTGNEKMPYHCIPCGICRIHRDRSFHCDGCNVCLDERLRNSHECRPDSGHEECCICLEDVFGGCQILLCSHKVHRKCANIMLQNGVRKCPVCCHPLNKPLQR